MLPCWYYDKKDLRDTPSMKDGISLDTERRYRMEGARFIVDCGAQMGLGCNTVATGVVYFHRFYMFHSFKSFPRYVTASCCLFLAGKVEETPKKCRDILQIARTLLPDNYFQSFGDNPKEEVMILERILLQTIKFDLQVEHPYSFLLKYAKCLVGNKKVIGKILQMAWNFVNDSLSTVLCLQWEPEIIAVAMIHLASKLSKFDVTNWAGREPNHKKWWDLFVANVTNEILEDICHQVLDLYQSNDKYKQATPSNSPPQKPPSRADSPKPTTSNQAKLPNSTQNGSLLAAAKSISTSRNPSPPATSATTAIQAAPTTTMLNTAVTTTTIVITAVSHSNSNDLRSQPIKPILTTVAPVLPPVEPQPPLPPRPQGVPPVVLSPASGNVPMHMFRHAPPPAINNTQQLPHTMYTSAPPMIPPPQPPIPRFMPPQTNSWHQHSQQQHSHQQHSHQQQPPTGPPHRFNHIPPLMSAAGGYYRPPHGSYNRQGPPRYQ